MELETFEHNQVDNCVQVVCFSMFKIPLLLITICLIHSALAAELNCLACIANKKVFCAFQETCVNSETECQQQQHNVTWFWTAERKNSEFRQYIPDYCLNGIITTSDQCLPDAMRAVDASIDREHATEMWNMNSPFGIQPRIKVKVRVFPDNETIVAGDLNYWDKVFSVGAYFISTPSYSPTDNPLFFSYVYHLWQQLPASFSREQQTITFNDLAAGGRRGYYRIGYTLLTPVKSIESNSTPLFQCSFMSIQKDIWQNSGYEGIWKGPHMYWGIPLIVLGFIANTLLFMCCAHRFEDASVDRSELEFSISERNFLRGQQKGKSFLLRLKDIILSVLLTEDAKLIEHCGTDIYFFLWFQKYLIVFVIICGVISMAVLLPVYTTSTDFSFYQDFAASTVASLRFTSNPKSYFQLLVTILFPFIGCVFLWRLRWLSRVTLRINNEYPSLFTVMMSGVPSDVKDKKELISDLSQQFGSDSIVDAHISFKLHKISRYWKGIRESQSLLQLFERETQNTNERPTIRECCCFKKDAIKHYIYELERYNRLFSNAKRSTILEGSGYVFVTFSSVSKAQAAVEQGRVNFCCGIKLPLWICQCIPFYSYKIQPAPEPDDIKHNNLYISAVSRWVRAIIANSAMTITLLFIYTITFLMSIYQHQKTLNFTTINEWGRTVGSTFLVQTAIDLIPEICGVVNELVKPVVSWGTRFERHKTRQSKRKSILRKTALYMMANTLILPNIYVYIKGVILVNFWAQEPFNNYTYFFNYSASGMIFLLVILCTIAKGLELTSMFLGMVIGYWRTHRLIRPKYDYECSMGFRIAILMVMLIYGSAAPLVFPFILFFFIFTYFMDKYWLMYYFRRSRDSDGKTLRNVADTISTYFSVFPVFILAMLPTLFGLLQTWLIFIPLWLVLVVILALLKKVAKAQKSKRIILGITRTTTEDQQTVQTGNSNNGDDDINNASIEEEDSKEPVSIDLQQQTSSATQLSSLIEIPLQTSFWRGVWENHLLGSLIGHERTLSNEEIERITTNLKRISSRYENPVLRALFKQKKKSRQQQQQQEEESLNRSD